MYVLLPVSLALGALGVAWFIWSVRSGQYDDLDTPAARVLFEDDRLDAGGSGPPPGRAGDDR